MLKKTAPQTTDEPARPVAPPRPLDPGKKKAVSVKAFDLLKDSTDPDLLVSLPGLVATVLRSDRKTAVEMWKSVLELQTKTGLSAENYSMCILWGIFSACGKAIGFGELGKKVILPDAYLCEKIFQSDSGIVNQDKPQNGPVPFSACYLIGYFIDSNLLTEAEECLQKLHDSTGRTASWYVVMDWILDLGVSRMDDKRCELFERWCEKAETREEQGRLALRLLEFLR